MTLVHHTQPTFLLCYETPYAVIIELEASIAVVRYGGEVFCLAVLKPIQLYSRCSRP